MTTDAHARLIDKVIILAVAGQLGLAGFGEYGNNKSLATIDARITRLEAQLKSCDPSALQPRSNRQWEQSAAKP